MPDAHDEAADVGDGGPRPGDPRSTGPRPGARWRDAVWLLVATGLGTLTLWQLLRLVLTVGSDAGMQPGGGGLLLAIAITVAWLLTISWLVLGAWRRTVWGCPFEHEQDAPPARRCPRHGLLPPG